MLPEAHDEIFHDVKYGGDILQYDVTSVHVLSNRNTRSSITDAEEMRRSAILNPITVEKRRHAAHGSRIGRVYEKES
jgi:hypothetical protein